MTHHEPQDHHTGMQLIRRMNALMDELHAMTEEARGWHSRIDAECRADWERRKAQLIADVEAYQRRRD